METVRKHRSGSTPMYSVEAEQVLGDMVTAAFWWAKAQGVFEREALAFALHYAKTYRRFKTIGPTQNALSAAWAEWQS